MRREIARLHKELEATIIYVTHDQVEAMTLGTKIVVMKDGRIQQIDTPEKMCIRDSADVSRKVENQNHSSSFSGRSSSGFRGRILSSFDRTAFGIYHTIDFGGHRFIIFLVYDRCEKDRR